MNKNIPEIDLEDTSYKDFMKENKVYIWQRTIDGIEELSQYPELEEVPVFIVHGGGLDKPKEFVIKRGQITDDHLDKAMMILETNEEYEYCAKIVKIQDDKKGEK